TTHGIHWIKASSEIKLIDSPGVIPLQKDDDIRYGLIGAKDSQNLKNPPVVADALIQLFLKTNKKEFEKKYNITIQKEDFDSIIEQIAKKRGYLLKGGVPDEYRTSILIVQDWQHGKLRL
ncbi:MAG: GTPase, partial [Nanoarchaeota archaeon]